MTAPRAEKNPLMALAVMVLYSEIKKKDKDPAFLFVLRGSLAKYKITMEQVRGYLEENRSLVMDILVERGMI